MSRANETSYIKLHETCKCKCRSNVSVCNNKQRWNKDKCRCECDKLVDQVICEIGYIWDPSSCECDDDDGELVWSTNERRLVLFPVETVVTDPHHWRHTKRKIRTCAEPEFWLYLMELCSSDKHYTTVPLNVNVINHVILETT